MNKKDFKAVKLEKGEMHVYDFGGLRADTYVSLYSRGFEGRADENKLFEGIEGHSERMQDGGGI